MYNVRYLYHQNFLQKVSTSFAKWLLEYGILTYDAARQTNLKTFASAQRKTQRAIYCEKRSAFSQQIQSDKIILNIYESYVNLTTIPILSDSGRI